MWKRLGIQWRIWRKRYLPFAIVYFIYPLIRLLTRTCSFEVEGAQRYHQIIKERPMLLLLWHDQLALIVSILSRFSQNQRYIGVVSDSRDGHLMSKLICSFPLGSTIQVAHNDRRKALKEMVRCLKSREGVVVMTPDGPRGPRHQAKQGAAVAALMSEACIVALKWEASSYWELNTWDRLAIPKPFARIRVSFGEPLFVEKGDWTIESLTEEVNKRLGGEKN